jgi:hypothetical protein
LAEQLDAIDAAPAVTRQLPPRWRNDLLPFAEAVRGQLRQIRAALAEQEHRHAADVRDLQLRIVELRAELLEAQLAAERARYQLFFEVTGKKVDTPPHLRLAT